MEPIEIISELRIRSIYDPKYDDDTKGLNALSWQILYNISNYLWSSADYQSARSHLNEGKSLAMNSKRIARYLKHYDKSHSQTIRASNQT